MTLSPLHCSWCVVSAYTWLALYSLSPLHRTVVWRILDWLILLSSPWCVVSAYLDRSVPASPLTGVGALHLMFSMTLSHLHSCSWLLCERIHWLSLSLSPLHCSGVVDNWCSCLLSFHLYWCGERYTDCLYLSLHPLHLWLSLSSPPVAGVWWAHTLDRLYDSLSSPPVAGVWWAHTLDCLYDSLSSPPVAGVWWAHTLDWLYDSLSSSPVAGVWWAHTLDWLYDLSLLSTCSWCVVRAYTWLSLCLSLLSTCSWCVHRRRCPVAAVASSKWMLHTGGGSGESPPPHPHDCKALWVYSNTQSAI